MSASSPQSSAGPESVSRPYERLKAYVVSDVHLNNHPWDRDLLPENPRHRHFKVFLQQINEAIRARDKVVLVLNGDILDITGSWFEEVMPWDSDGGRVSAAVSRVVQDILTCNMATVEALRQLLQHPLTELVYVYGNHDGLLAAFPEARRVFRDMLSTEPSVRERIRFVDEYDSDELDLHVEHGHRLDPFNRYERREDPPLGDVINILVVNRFVELALSRLRDNGYPEDFVRRLNNRLHDIEYLRPLALVPVWIQTMANQYQHVPESRGRPKSVYAILIEVVYEIVNDPKMVQYLVSHLHLPRPVIYLLIKMVLRIPAILPVLSFLTSKVVRRTHSNKYQYKAAQRIRQAKGCRLIAFGHTHIPGVSPLSQDAYYFNTGSWKPVINLFRFTQDVVELAYLHPEVQFNKVERCGILRIEKTDFDLGAPAEFALQTIQSGLS